MTRPAGEPSHSKTRPHVHEVGQEVGTADRPRRRVDRVQRRRRALGGRRQVLKPSSGSPIRTPAPRRRRPTRPGAPPYLDGDGIVRLAIFLTVIADQLPPTAASPLASRHAAIARCAPPARRSSTMRSAGRCPSSRGPASGSRPSPTPRVAVAVLPDPVPPGRGLESRAVAQALDDHLRSSSANTLTICHNADLVDHYRIRSWSSSWATSPKSAIMVV